MGGALVVCFWAFLSPDLRAAEPDRSPAITLEAAKKQLQANRDAEAEVLLSGLLRSDTRSPLAAEANFLLGQAQAKQKRVDEALRTFSNVLSSHAGTEWAARSLEASAQLQQLRRNPTAAQQLRDELLKGYPESPVTVRVWAGVADHLFREEKFSAAVAIYQKLGKSLPPASTQLFAIAQVLLESDGDPAKLLPIANQALAQNNLRFAKPLYKRLAKSPKAGAALPQIETQLGWCIYLEGRDEALRQAERLWRGVISRTKPADPWYAESRWHLVQLAAGPEGNWSKAVALCQEIAREQAPGTFAQEQALFARAWLLTVHKQWKPAVAAFDDLAAAYPEKLLHPPVQRYRELALQGPQTGKGMP